MQSPRTSFAEEARQLARLAGPLVVAQAGQALMGLVDTAVVGRAGAAPLAGTALGQSLFFTISIFGMGALMGLDPLVSQALGAGQPLRARRMLWQGVWLSFAITALLSVPMMLLPLCLRPVGIPDEVATQATRFLLMRTPGLLPLLLFSAVRAYLQAAGRPQSLAWSTLAANVINLGLDVLFVFGGDRLPGWTGPLRSIPAMGAAGAALSTTFCTLFQMAVVCWVVARMPLPERPADLRRPMAQDLRRAARIGIPIGLHLGAEVAVFALAGVFAGRLGKEALGAHQIALALSSLTFTVSVGLGNAGSVRVGWAVGARNTPAARVAGFTAFACTAGFMSLGALTFWLFPRALVGLMTNEPGVAEIAVPLLAVAAVFQLSDGTQGVGAGVLRGAGDSRSTFIANVVGHYAIGLPLSLFLGFGLGLGIIGIWWGLCAGLTAVALGVLLRFWRLSSRPILPVAEG